ncbi:NADP-dependent oxidoreductase [Rhodohalobacter mucosus]|uniref:NADP-dependent oxidoreductase n=1 Tax=Rhodohalobacter mucosus TaxID=2079485 RepID=A0A316TVI0_9BACT|nr:NADP-dependent oxidoreductase [Rhodohalobacter mucosus]PWN06492.1 NADP-dependent oxidoreductase [Rhodohalobacter mucosus]
MSTEQEKMTAAYINDFGGPDKVQTGELDKPEPDEGDVLVRVGAAGVNPVDAAVVQGMLKDAIPSDFPLIPGWDLAGTVEARGYAARRFEVGDKVMAYARRPVIQQGTFAEYVALPEAYLARKPEFLSIKQAGGVPLTGLTAYQSLFDAGQLKEGETIVILGASGGVGSFAVQLASWKGARVIGVAGSSNQEYMIELGADETIDYSAGDVGEAVNEIAPDGVDFIYHCSRGDSLSQCADTIRQGGRLISITDSNPDRRDDVRFEYVFVEPNASQLGHLARLADGGHLDVNITQTWPLDEADEALKSISELHTRGKTVVTV